VEETGDLSVPLTLRNAPTKLMKELGHGKEYRYAHDHLSSFTEMEFLPKDLEGHQFYEPSKNTKEIQFRKFLKSRWGEKYNY
jgi:putative ATPase